MRQSAVQYFSELEAQTVRVTVATPDVVVRRVEQPVIWVTLPGDNASHKLTEQQAKELLRKLEEVV